MRRVILVRHGAHPEIGKVLSGRSEIGLSARGVAEAQALAHALDAAALVSFHASPRRRARETIAPVADRCGGEVRIAPALDEIDFGTFAGREFSILADDPHWQKWNAERGTARCPGGETMAEAVARVSDYLDALAPADFPALCVTHCDIIRGLVADRLGLDLEHMFRFDCDPASRTTLDWAQGDTRLVALNERV